MLGDIVMTPWQLGFVATVLRALARNDIAAMRVWVAQPAWPMRLFADGVSRITRITAEPWCREALAPWGDDAHPGPRTKKFHEQGTTTLARFAERGGEVVVLVIERNPDAKLVDVRRMRRSDFESFGHTV